MIGTARLSKLFQYRTRRSVIGRMRDWMGVGLVCGWVCCTGSALNAQGLPGSGPPPATGDPGASALQQQLQQLIEATEKARQSRAADAWLNTDGDPSTSTDPIGNRWSSEIDASPIAGEDDAAATEKLSEIRERLRILQRFRRERSLQQQTRSALPADLPEWNPPPSTAPMTPAEPVPNELDQQVAPALEKPSVEADVPPTPGNPDVPPADASVDGERLLPGAVDSFALGESLYRTGNYESALQALLAAETRGMSQSERTWLDLMIALCQRKTGDYEKAEGNLRDISNAKSSDYPVQAAKWWLKYTEADHETKTKLEALEAEVDLLLERSRSHVQP